jgi:hypothetical protein
VSNPRIQPESQEDEIMTRTILAALCASTASFAVAAEHSQTPQSQPQKPQSQESQQSQMQKQTVSLTGCVFQASDQPTLFALQRTNDTKAGQTAQAGTSQERTEKGQSGAATGTAGTSGAGMAGMKGAEGAWYRLTLEGTRDLKQYKGQAVRVSGTLVPGKDSKGADVVIHRIEPEKTVVTAIDLQPAPQLRIQSISPLAGVECPAPAKDKR